MAEKGLCIIPRMLARTCEERTSKAGGALFYVTVEAEFDLISSEDGSKHTARTFGEAMDSGDKATNKAMSAAYKYMAFQTFAIPTEGDNDSESSHEVVKHKLDAKRLSEAIQRIKEGRYTTIKLRETFALTPEQDAQVIAALSEAE
jgi:glutamine synthetase